MDAGVVNGTTRTGLKKMDLLKPSYAPGPWGVSLCPGRYGIPCDTKMLYPRDQTNR